MKIKQIIFLIIFSFNAVISMAAKTDKELQTIDRVYEENIKTVMLYPSSTPVALKDATQPAIVAINDSRSLLLSFDELGNTTQNYYMRILNCNSDWTLSNLNAIMYLSEYNEYQIFDRQSSFNTRMAYIHYKMPIPKTKISGNFLIMIYRDGDDQDLILTRRFMVYENNTSLNPQIKFPVSNSERNTGQQVDFTLTYGANIQNPMERMKVVIRQNYNWRNSIYDLKPAFMRDDIRTYEYTFFNNENVFKGGNEFRFFDLRSLKSNGMNISKITFTQNNNEVLLGYDQSRKSNAYSTSYDINGFYAPEQYETKGFETEPDYAKVIFTLDIKKEDVPGRIFVMGALTDWAYNADFEMKWDEEFKVYTCSPILKQGYYNYFYTVIPTGSSTPDDGLLEGSFSQTQNVYDFIMYYRGPAGMYDRIIGYKSIDYLAPR